MGNTHGVERDSVNFADHMHHLHQLFYPGIWQCWSILNYLVYETQNNMSVAVCVKLDVFSLCKPYRKVRKQ